MFNFIYGNFSVLPEKENTGQCARSPKQTNEITSAAEQGLAMLRLRQVHFPFPYLCLNGMILPTASLNCFFLSQLLPYSIQNLPSSFVYITEMNNRSYEGNHCTCTLQHTALFFIIREMASTA